MISDLYAQKLVFDWCPRASEIHRALKPLAIGVSYCGEGGSERPLGSRWWGVLKRTTTYRETVRTHNRITLGLLIRCVPDLVLYSGRGLCYVAWLNLSYCLLTSNYLYCFTLTAHNIHYLV